MDEKRVPGTDLATTSAFNTLVRKTGLTQYLIPETSPVTSSEVLKLGVLSPVSPSEQSDFGKWLGEAVKATRQIPTDKQSRDWPLTFAGYCDAISKLDSIKRAFFQEDSTDRDVYVPGDSPELRRFVKKLYQSERHTPDFEGYINYLGDANDRFAQAIWTELQRTAVEIREDDRKLHTYIVGGTGSGKSELMKLLIHHYVRHQELGAVLVLDPHGKVAREVAEWQEFAGSGEKRLVYLDAKATQDMAGLVPSLNPIQRGNLGEDQLVDLAGQLADALAYLAGEGEGQTSYMQRLARFGLLVLLDKPGSTLMDLLAAVSGDDGEPLVSAGLVHRNPLVQNHYKNQFFSDSYRSARRGLAARLEGALLGSVFRRMMTLPSPLNLPDALDAGKVVLVNCASAGEARAALGRFMIAQVTAMGKRRLEDPFAPYTPVHVFVDEATVLMAPPVFTILEELRKVGIHLTMVQQSFGRGLDRELMGSLKTNTRIKMFGINDNMGDVFKVMDWGRDRLPKLKEREFIVSVGGQRMTLATAGHLADRTNAMAAGDWQRVVTGQLTRYYGNPKQDAATIAKPEPAVDIKTRTWPR